MAVKRSTVIEHTFRCSGSRTRRRPTRARAAPSTSGTASMGWREGTCRRRWFGRSSPEACSCGTCTSVECWSVSLRRGTLRTTPRPSSPPRRVGSEGEPLRCVARSVQCAVHVRHVQGGVHAAMLGTVRGGGCDNVMDLVPGAAEEAISFDRIDCSKGHMIQNLRAVCLACNRRAQDGDGEY